MKYYIEDKRRVELRGGEAGIALAVVLLFVLVLAGMITALLFSSSSGAINTGGYRIESETLLIGDAGLQETIDWFSSSAYVSVADNAVDEANLNAKLSVYNLNTSPVTLVSGGQPVTLTTFKNASSTMLPSYYPAFTSALAAVDDSFIAKFADPQVKLNDIKEGKYRVDAKLLSMRRVKFLNGTNFLGAPGVIERWHVKIESRKDRDPNANNQIEAIIELGTQPALPAVLSADEELTIKECVNVDSIDSKGLNSPAAAPSSSPTTTAGWNLLGGTSASVLSNDKMEIKGSAGNTTVINGKVFYINPNPSGTAPTIIEPVDNGPLTVLPTPFVIPPPPVITLTTPFTPSGSGSAINEGNCGQSKIIGIYDVDVQNPGSCTINFIGGSTFLKMALKNRPSVIVSAGDSKFKDVDVDDGSRLEVGSGQSTFLVVTIDGKENASTYAGFDAGGPSNKIKMADFTIKDGASVLLGPGIYEIENKLEIDKNSKLLLSPGTTINVKDLTVGDKSGAGDPVFVGVTGPGQVQINVTNNTYVKKGALFNIDCPTVAGCTAASAMRPPSDFIFTTKGVLTIEENAVVSAVMLAGQKADIKKGSTIVGTVLSEGAIVVENGPPCVKIRYDKHLSRIFVTRTRFRTVSWVKSNFR